MSESRPLTLFIRLRKRVRLPNDQTIRLGDIADLYINTENENMLRLIPLHQPTGNDGSVVLLDMLRIIKAIHRLNPGLLVESYGEPHVLVELEKPSKAANPLWIILVWLLLFFGSGMAIMNFHEDVSMLDVQRRLVELITGVRVDRPYWFQIPYSLGIGIGMVLFFNHLFKKKLNEEPSPLEVEMYLYQENVNQYMITDEYHKMLESRGSERR